MFPILHCDVTTSMFHADHAREHTWGYEVQVAVIVTSGLVLSRFFVQQKHKKLNYGTYSLFFRALVFHTENNFTKSRL
jgi:hypothetical protein